MTGIIDFSLDNNTYIELKLVWLSCKDVNVLKSGKNYALLEASWQNVKTGLRPYFKDQPFSLEEITADFKKITLTMDPTMSFGYDSERNILLFHLWSLFLDSTVDEHQIINIVPTLPWKRGGELVHEHDHYLFLSAQRMIGKSKQAQDIFAQKYWVQIETRAFSNQIAFLERCKLIVPASYLTQGIRVSAWTVDGEPTFGLKCRSILFPKAKIIESIDQMIREYTAKIHEIKAGQDYSKAAKRNDTSVNSKMAKTLSLPIKLDQQKAPYSEIEINM